MLDKNRTKLAFDSKFIKIYEYERPGANSYYVASRKDKDRFTATLSDEEAKTMLPDAVSCFVVLNVKGEEPKLLLNWEFRYPVGQYMLSVPAGLIDKKDYENPNALTDTAVRELMEETGIQVTDADEVKVVNPGVFSTPGMTDENNALVYISINRDQMPSMDHDHAEKTEKFQGFRLVTKKEAEKYLVDGKDEHGNYYPLFTWAALMFFIGV
ncbi:MAG: NUDIX hydrolase [Lachnospiraceae bacterium]|nr:NUDIX hydrolase [Lachnospiraceae bacterium]